MADDPAETALTGICQLLVGNDRIACDQWIGDDEFCDHCGCSMAAHHDRKEARRILDALIAAVRAESAADIERLRGFLEEMREPPGS